MTKKIFAVIIAFVFCISMSVSASAYYDEYVFAPDNLLSDSELTELNGYAESIESNYGYTVVFCIVNDTEGLSCYDYAREVASDYTDAENLIVFVNNTEEDVYDFYTFGDEAESLDNELLGEIFAVYNSDNSYFGGVSSLYASVEDVLENNSESIRVDDNSEDEELDDIYADSDEPKSISTQIVLIPVCLAVGIFIGFLIIKSIASKNISVKMQKNATIYTRSGSMTVTGSYDNFLYREVDRRAKPKNNKK